MAGTDALAIQHLALGRQELRLLRHTHLQHRPQRRDHQGDRRGGRQQFPLHGKDHAESRRACLLLEEQREGHQRLAGKDSVRLWR